MTEQVDAVRVEAAKACRLLLEAARKIADVREMIIAICARKGVTTLVDLADAEPWEVIGLWESVELLEEGSYDKVVGPG